MSDYRAPAAVAALALVLVLAGCRSARSHREQADRVALATIERAQLEALGRSETFTVRPAADALRRRLLRGQDLPVVDPASFGAGALEAPPQVKDRLYLDQDRAALAALDPLGDDAVVLDLRRALMVAAANSRAYQARKEDVFRTALQLDLERDDFRGTWEGSARGEAIAELMAGEDLIGVESGTELGYTKRFANGMSVAGAIGLDLVRLLTFGESSSLGLVADLSISIPLLRGSSRFVVTEPLRQAERDVIYAIYELERFKQTFAVEVATGYLDALSQLDRIETSAENYRSLLVATRRARRLAAAGRLPEIQVDQAHQDELRARQSWVSALQNYQRRLDEFKLLLGLPVDAEIALDPGSLAQLEEELAEVLTDYRAPPPAAAAPADAPVTLRPPDDDGGPWEIAEDAAIVTALEGRYDLKVALGQVHDALRRIAVAADDLRADLTLLGSGRAGAHRSLSQAGLADAELRPGRGSYSLLLSLDLPFDRTAERNTYRAAWIALEAELRELQELEDRVKLAVRSDLRTLLEARERARIQAQSLILAERRVESTELFLQAGRAEIRDLLEAQESLVDSRNQLTSAIIAYRSAEWQLQADLGLLAVGADGLWPELRLGLESIDEAIPEGPAEAGEDAAVPVEEGAL